ncbi:acetate/propionate family kinase [Anaerofustis sp. LCP19S3_F7]|uniref:acetate/propionate family kinase n=1 Tax=Anaerofustis sp. LCP19S3_F7 TaxID=3440247 RepID=UPI003F92CE76
MKVLVINCGSSSLKYQLIDMDNNNVLANGVAERIGLEDGILTHKQPGKDNVVFNENMPTHKEALQILVKALVDKEYGVISSLDEISAIGHRITTGGEKYNESIKATDEVIEGLKECSELAPLHIPGQVMGLLGCKEVFPGKEMVCVFDTSFHRTIPKQAYMYPIPYEYYEKYSIRKYGFHGISHQFVSQKVAELMNKDVKDLKVIVCHLGNGASISAVNKGECIENSMGFTPLDGLEMGTRSGSIDPSVIPFLCEKENKTPKEVEDILNKESGLLGVSGVSSDFRDITDAMEKGNERAKLAFDIFVYRVKTTIGAYTAAMNGVDCIAFTGGIGENSTDVRAAILKDMEFFGIDFDEEANNVRGKAQFITKPSSKTTCMVVPTNEELMIAKETINILK